jgi:solute carrier family 39 (zinc transporter), member 1/2/3
MRGDEKKPCCNFTPFILMIALSVHACFEGLALGIQPDFTSALSIMLAVVIHKGAASSALGISLVKNFPDDFRLVRWLIFTFSMATPIGIAIGIAASGAGVIVDIVFSSLAAGTFVYIGCTEIIVSEFSIPGDRWLKLFVFLIGATIITCLFFIPGS